MPRYHRPDIASLHQLKKLPQTKFKIGKWNNRFLLPSINLEDLSKTKNLLLFMRSRGRNSSGLFATSDFKSIHVGLHSTHLVLAHVTGTMIILEGNDPSTYGRLHKCGSDNDVFEEIAANRGTVAGVGVLIMTIQERILDFLRHCAELILHDIPLENSSDPLQPDPGEVVLANEETQHLSLQTEILESAYRVPPRHDMSRLRSFVFAKRDEYQDDIWNLREDPIHFTDTIQEWAEHRPEQVRTANGGVSPQLGKKEWWERTINTMVTEVYSSFHTWNLLSKHVEKLSWLKDTYGDHIYDNETIANDFDDAVDYLEFLVDQAIIGLIMKWKNGLGASHSFENTSS
ncbi:MAG: hypothetical protein Q9195_005127 [Heterodermia aff. obscurata]